MYKPQFIVLIKILILVAILVILLWMIFAGGCLHNDRVKIYQGSVKIDITILFILFWLISGMLYITQSSSRIKMHTCLKNLRLEQLELLSMKFLI